MASVCLLASKVAAARPTTPHDECDFIRFALRALPATGGTVTIPAGTFVCSTMILIDRSHVKLRGAGRTKTVLRLANAAHAPVLVVGDANVVQNKNGEWVTTRRVKDIEVSHLTVDGNLANQDPWRECGNHSCEGDPVTIRNNAITIRGASNVRIENVTTHSAISGGLVTEKYCDHLYIRNLVSYGNYFDGFAGCQTEHSLIENVYLSGNRAAGISLDIKFKKNHFRNGVLERNGDVGIFARDTSQVVFEDLLIKDNKSHGVFLADAGHSETCASRNELRSVRIEESQGHGIYLASGCAGNKVTGRSVLQQNRSGCFHVHPQASLALGQFVRCLEETK